MLSVVLAAVAMGLSSRRYLRRHLDACAVMRCFGAQRRQLLTIYGLAFTLFALALALLGGLIGFTAQAVLAKIAAGLVAAELPAPGGLPALHGLLVALPRSPRPGTRPSAAARDPTARPRPTRSAARRRSRARARRARRRPAASPSTARWCATTSRACSSTRSTARRRTSPSSAARCASARRASSARRPSRAGGNPPPGQRLLGRLQPRHERVRRGPGRRQPGPGAAVAGQPGALPVVGPRPGLRRALQHDALRRAGVDPGA